MGSSLARFNRRKNRPSLAIFDCKEIARLGTEKIALSCGGAAKFAAATAGNRAILVHLGGGLGGHTTLSMLGHFSQYVESFRDC